jgi:hypothetical protein
MEIYPALVKPPEGFVGDECTLRSHSTLREYESGDMYRGPYYSYNHSVVTNRDCWKEHM